VLDVSDLILSMLSGLSDVSDLIPLMFAMVGYFGFNSIDAPNCTFRLHNVVYDNCMTLDTFPIQF